MGRSTGRQTRPRALAATALALLAVLLLPAVAAAHPLGNFTINHYAGIRVEPARITLDIVIDQAEIPAFQTRQSLDVDGDGDLSAAEIEAGRSRACGDLAPSLDLRVGTDRVTLDTGPGRLSFPPGAGGLTTMRLECPFTVALAQPMTAGTSVDFRDASFAERIGWREIVVTAAGVAVDGDGLRATSPSARLTAYPADLLAAPLDDRSVSFAATPTGAPVAATGTVPPVSGAVPAAHVDPAIGAAPAATTTGAVPGGVIAGELPSIFRAADLTPVVLLISLLTAGALGAGHALTPGHGKTLMAAYLVGTRGTPLHAVGLGLSVTVSHTIGILALAAVIVGAQGLVAPDLVVRWAPIVAAVSIVAIGGWMLLGEIRRRRAAGAAHALAHAHDLDHPHAHDDEHPHTHEEHHPDVGATAGEHTHGGVSHSHLPAAGTTITWRGLFALGLAGGLIPSTSALLILLGSLAAGRPAFGFVLVVAFGLGMAAVMSGIGIALVLARGRLDRLDGRTRLGRVGSRGAAPGGGPRPGPRLLSDDAGGRRLADPLDRDAIGETPQRQVGRGPARLRRACET